MQECAKLDLEIDRLLKFKAVEKCSFEKGQFLSSFFLIPKADGSNRFILNLKDLNECIKKEHFKMEDLRTALNLLNRNDYMCKIDLKDAYLAVPIGPDSKRFLRFEHNGHLYQFNALPFGLTSAPYVFTKIMKAVITWLRERQVKAVVYLDDFLIMGRTRTECQKSTKLTLNLLHFLGFLVNWGKCTLDPSQLCTFLGISIKTTEMTLELPMVKRLKIKRMLEEILKSKSITIQALAECTGTLVAACPAIAYGWLYYKELERLKNEALSSHNGNMQKRLNLSIEAVTELKWWLSKILTADNRIRSSSFDKEIFSDASTTGWGAVCGKEKARGFWNKSEREMHINFLEIKAAFLALKCFAKTAFKKQILLRIDSITALAYINKMGGLRHKNLHYITKELWEWCQNREIWIFAEYVASKSNLADEGSRVSNLDTEWELADRAFHLICRRFGKPTVDLFATRVNKKCTKYCSWERDPEAYCINAFTWSWTEEFWYAFPPFSLISKVLKKVREEGSTGILIVPYWAGQPWFPDFEDIVKERISFPPSTKLLLSPCRKITHPLSTSLTLVAGIVCGISGRGKT